MKITFNHAGLTVMRTYGYVVTTLDPQPERIIWGGLSLIKTPYAQGNWKDTKEGYAVDLEICPQNDVTPFGPSFMSHGCHVELWFPTYARAGKVFGKIGRKLHSMNPHECVRIMKNYMFDDINSSLKEWL